MDDSFEFRWEPFLGFLKGINGRIIGSKSNDDHVIAQSCSIEIVENDTFRTWKKCIKKQELDHRYLSDIPDLVSILKDSLHVGKTTTTLTLTEKPASDGNLCMVLTFPVLGETVSVEFVLEAVQQDEMCILQKRVDLLTGKVQESKKNEESLFADMEESKQKEQRNQKNFAELKESKKKLFAEIEKSKKNEQRNQETIAILKQSNKKLLVEMCESKEELRRQESKFCNIFHILAFATLLFFLPLYLEKAEERFVKITTNQADKKNMLSDLLEKRVEEIFLEISRKETETRKMEERIEEKLEEITRKENDAEKMIFELWEKKMNEELAERTKNEMDKNQELSEFLEKRMEEKLAETTREEIDVNQVFSELLEKRLTEDELVTNGRKFAACGKNLYISKCGTMVAHTGRDSSRSAMIGETMSTGMYYAEFMPVRMNAYFDFMWGILPAEVKNLNTYINGIPGGVRVDAYDGRALKHGYSGAFSIGLPGGCDASTNGPCIVGVLLDLDNFTVQFFINGLGSNTTIDIAPGEYSFAVSLYYQWEAVKLLTLEKLH